jgi:hypothetical protein
VQAGSLLAGAALHRRPPGVAILSAALATSFLLQIVASLDESVEWLRWFSPYALWVNGDAFHYQPDLGYLVASVILIAACVPLAARVWVRKDLRA